MLISDMQIMGVIRWHLSQVFAHRSKEKVCKRLPKELGRTLEKLSTGLTDYLQIIIILYLIDYH